MYNFEICYIEALYISFIYILIITAPDCYFTVFLADVLLIDTTKTTAQYTAKEAGFYDILVSIYFCTIIIKLTAWHADNRSHIIPR